jgi:hypothetical protein
LEKERERKKDPPESDELEKEHPTEKQDFQEMEVPKLTKNYSGKKDSPS